MPEIQYRPCPVCGSKAQSARAGWVTCQNMSCYLFAYGLPIAAWQSRPLEDALQEKLNLAEVKLAKYERKEVRAETISVKEDRERPAIFSTKNEEE